MLRRSLIAICLAGLTIGAAPASATVFTVTTGGDAYPDNATCTLREAVVASNLLASSGGCPAGTGNDTINITAAKVTLTQLGAGDASASAADLDVTRTLTIQGAPGGTTIDGSHIDRLFDVAVPGNLTLRGLRLTGGLTPNGADGSGISGLHEGRAGGSAEDGGALRNRGTLLLENDTVSGNTTGKGGNGASVSGSRTNDNGGIGGQGGDGGGIFSSGSLTIRSSKFSGNSTGIGGIGGTGTGLNGATTPSVVPDGEHSTGGIGGVGGNGGAVASTGTLTITDSTFTANNAGNGGDGGNGHGGAGLAVSSGTPGAGGEGDGGRGGVGGGGGAVAVMEGTASITRSLMNANFSGNGGAGGVGYGGSGGTVASGSSNAGAGGAGHGNQGGIGGDGGAVYAFYDFSGASMLTVTSSTIAGNNAGAGGVGGNGFGANGGNASAGIGGKGGDASGGSGGTGGNGAGAAQTDGLATLVLSADTVVGNAAGPGGVTGASAIAGGGGTAATIGQNGLVSFGGAGAAGQGGIERGAVTDSIISANTPTGCDAVTPSANSHNIVYPDATCPGTVADPGLGAIGDHGGPTSTYRLDANSPAVDVVPAVNGGCPDTDQRGIARPQGSACDAGAYERAAPFATTGTATATSTTASVAGTVNPNLLATTVHVDYNVVGGPTQSTPTQTVPAGAAAVPVTVALAGLTPTSTYRYRVIATSADGSSSGDQQTFSTAHPDSGGFVGDIGNTGNTGGTTPPPPAKPAVSGLALKPSSFRVATKTKKKGRGTVITYADTLAVKTTLTVGRAAKGVISGTACVAPPKHPKRGAKKPKACTRYPLVEGSLVHTDTAGPNTIAWTGALGTKSLAPGKYELIVTPAGGAAVARTFTIKR